MTGLDDALAPLADEQWWMAHGLCRQIGPALFYSDWGDASSATVAKRICGTCDVQPACLAYALDHEYHGVWGGYSRKERQRLRTGKPVQRIPRARVTVQCTVCGAHHNARRQKYCGPTCRAQGVALARGRTP